MAILLDDIENIILDLVFRGNRNGGVPFTAPTTLYVGLLNSAGVELSGGGYARQAVTCNQQNWVLGVDSSNVVYGAINNTPVKFPNLGQTATISGVIIYSALVGGITLFATKINTPYVVSPGDAYGPQIYAGDLAISFYGVSNTRYPFSQYLVAKLTEFFFFGNPNGWAPPTTLYLGLLTGDITSTFYEVSTTTLNGYARIAIPCSNVSSLNPSWTSTDGTAVYNATSTGTTGIISNKNQLTFPTITGSYGLVTAMALYDAASTGNLLWMAPLGTSTRVDNGDNAPYVPVGQLQVYLMSAAYVI